MTTARKVDLVQQVHSAAGLTPALATLGLPRATWYYWTTSRKPLETRYAALRRPLEAIARECPEYGYRRATAELRDTYGQLINRKVVQKLHRLWDLPLIRTTRPPRPSAIRKLITEVGDRVNLVARLDQIGPFQVVYTDFTELVFASGKAQLMVLVDHATKVALGWAVGEQAVTELALQAWEMTKRRLRRLGRTCRGIIVHHDQDPVYTGYGWLGQLFRDRARVSYALRGARDNPEMESFFSRFKNENRSLLLDAKDRCELRTVVRRRIGHYNRRRRHSALGNQAPLTIVSSLKPQK